MTNQEKKDCVYGAMKEVEKAAKVIGEIIDDAKENDPVFYEELKAIINGFDRGQS